MQGDVDTPYAGKPGANLLWPEMPGMKRLVGGSPSFLAETAKVPLVAGCDVGVLVTGETGTGKELFARAIHGMSPRAGRPFTPAHCGSIPSELVENELFGHERGAYTGADSAYPGLVMAAEGGVLFLDEVDCLSLSAQAKLLRFLQEKEFRRLGSTEVRRADVRVIAATNADLERMTADGRFRKDLYYRLSVVPLVLPPLRERREDVLPLAMRFVEIYNLEFGRRVSGFSSEAAQALMAYGWPGNVRELEHVVERAVLFSEGPVIEASRVSPDGRGPLAPPLPFREAKECAIAEFETRYIKGLLTAHGGNITSAARAADKDRRAFWELMRKHNIDAREFSSRRT